MRHVYYILNLGHHLNRRIGLTCISSNTLEKRRAALNANKENGSLFDKMYSDVLFARVLQSDTATIVNCMRLL